MAITEFLHPASSSVMYSTCLDRDLREDVFCRGSKNNITWFLSCVIPICNLQVRFFFPTKSERSPGTVNSQMPQNILLAKFHHCIPKVSFPYLPPHILLSMSQSVFAHPRLPACSLFLGPSWASLFVEDSWTAYPTSFLVVQVPGGSSVSTNKWYSSLSTLKC